MRRSLVLLVLSEPLFLAWSAVGKSRATSSSAALYWTVCPQNQSCVER